MEDYRGSSSSDSGNKTSTCHRGHWRPAEDEKLRQLVDQYGPQNWNFIAEHLQGRSGKSCRLRWYNQLDPNINKRPFTEEEEERLLKAHQIQGNRWASIARLFPGRTDNAVKNHYHVVMARRKRESCLTHVHGKRSNNFQVQYPTSSDHHRHQSNRNFEGCFRPRVLLDRYGRGPKLGFQNNNIERMSASSNSSSPSWTNISASTITNDSLSFDVFDAKRKKDYVHSYPKDGGGGGGPLALNNNLSSLLCDNTYNPSSSIYGGNCQNVVGQPMIPNSKKPILNNPFAFTSYGDHQHGYGRWKLPMASQQEEGDRGGIKNKDVSFIDFLGVGIS